MRILLLSTIFLLFQSCATKIEKRPVEYYNILKIKEFTNGETNFVPDVYSEGDIIFDKHTNIATFTLKANENIREAIFLEFESSQQGLRIDEIYTIQKYNVTREENTFTLDEIDTYFLVEGRRTKGVQDYFNNRHSRIKNKENSGLANLIKNAISPEKEYLPYIIIEKSEQLILQTTKTETSIKGDETELIVHVLPEYKHINN